MNDQPKKRIVIMGLGQGWQLCPYDPDQEIWAVAKIVNLVPKPRRVDRLFILDDIEKLLSTTLRFWLRYNLLAVLTGRPMRVWFAGRDQFVWQMNHWDIPVYLYAAHPEIPKSVAYPLKEIVEKYGIWLFTNTICYMIALALYEGATEIDLYGVNQVGREEYELERRGVEVWLSIAANYAKVSIHGPSALFENTKGKLYGYKATPKELVERYGINL